MALFNSIRMGAAGAGEAYEIERSVRFNSAETAVKLTRTFSGGSTTTWTLSVWVKRTKFGVTQPICGYYTADTNSQNPIRFNSSDQLEWYNYTGGYQGRLVTNRVFRDSSSWYHLVFVWDTTNGTAGDRMKIYVNGVEETSFATDANPSPSQASHWNSNNEMTIGTTTNYNDGWFDGYMAEMHFIDNAVKSQNDFGKTDIDTGQWIPKKYAGSHGTTGFFLSFKDNSSAANMFVDDSSNSNNWTHHNMSADTNDEINCDSFSDTPTNNWCTMNVNNNPNGAGLSQGGLAVSLVYPHGDNGMYATFGVTSGKWYWEAKCTSAGNRGQVGVTDAGHKSGSNSGYNFSVATRHTGGTDDTSGTSNSNLDAVIASGNWVTFCFDADNGQIWYSREAAPDISGTANVTGLTLGKSRSWKPHIRETGNPVSNFTFNFGASAAGFKYGPPNDDYKALNAANLPEPTIKNGTKHFNTIIHDGNGDQTRTFTGVGFQPDLIWHRIRTGTTQGLGVFDAVRSFASDKALTIATATGGTTEGTWQSANSSEYGYISGVTSDGFTVNDGTVSTNGGYVNHSGRTYVAWNWKGGGSTTSNSDGTIVGGSQVRVNGPAGFSLGTFTAQSSGSKTVGHGLGVEPEVVITKSRTVASNWYMYHHTIGQDGWVLLDDAGVATTSNSAVNNPKPTASVFTYGSGLVNQGDVVFYAFSEVAGYSKFGSYKGNGVANGAFEYCGFKPAFVLLKRTNTAASWVIHDNKRAGYNGDNDYVHPDLNQEESDGSTGTIDLLSNGFKLRMSAGTHNDGTYVYMAFAETPFKYANAR